MRPLLLVAVLVLAGCTTPLPSEFEPDFDPIAALDAYLTGEPGHDHSNPAHHPGISWNLDEVWETTVPMQGGAASPPSEFSIWNDLAFVSTFHPSAGFAIINISNPAEPRHVGYYDAGTAYTNDVEVTDDGKWAIVPTQNMVTAEDDATGPLLGDPTNPGLGDVPLASDYGLQIVDLTDLQNPERVAIWHEPNSCGYHRVDVLEIGGEIILAAADVCNQETDILRFEPEPVPHVTPITSYQAHQTATASDGQGLGWGSYSVHDTTLILDPLTGEFPLLGVAHWRAGAHFLDSSDPSNPVLLGWWDNFTDVLPGNVHNVEFGAIEGKRYAFVSPEYPIEHDRQGIVWIVDITDFNDPQLAGTWSLPGHHPVTGGTYVYTSDRVEYQDGYLYSSHFHAGVLVIDVSTTQKIANPELVAYNIPKGETALPYFGFTTNPLVYDAIPYQDHVLYADLSGGFHGARLTID